MKIYFSGSIRGGRENQKIYKSLINHLKKFGQVLTEHIGEEATTDKGESLPDSNIHKRDMEWLNQADVVVAEVTTPSLGVGYEIGRALETEKPILCLYKNEKERKISAMIKGAPQIENKPYKNLTEGKKFISNFLKINEATQGI